MDCDYRVAVHGCRFQNVFEIVYSISFVLHILDSLLLTAHLFDTWHRSGLFRLYDTWHQFRNNWKSMYTVEVELILWAMLRALGAGYLLFTPKATTTSPLIPELLQLVPWLLAVSAMLRAAFTFWQISDANLELRMSNYFSSFHNVILCVNIFQACVPTTFFVVAALESGGHSYDGAKQNLWLTIGYILWACLGLFVSIACASYGFTVYSLVTETQKPNFGDRVKARACSSANVHASNRVLGVTLVTAGTSLICSLYSVWFAVFHPYINTNLLHGLFFYICYYIGPGFVSVPVFIWVLGRGPFVSSTQSREGSRSQTLMPTTTQTHQTHRSFGLPRGVTLELGDVYGETPQHEGHLEGRGSAISIP